MGDDWVDRAACAGTDPDVFFAPLDRHGWAPSRARAICATCPVVVECLTDAIERREQYGIWGGAGGLWRRDLTVAWRARTHDGYRPGCGCVWCTAVTEHLTRIRTRHPRRTPTVLATHVTHGRRSTYARGCRCGRCLFATRPARDLIRVCGTDIPQWWDGALGPRHGLSHLTAAADATDATLLLRRQLGAVLGASRGKRRLAAVGAHTGIDVERLAATETGTGDVALSPVELAALLDLYGLTGRAILGERGAA